MSIAYQYPSKRTQKVVLAQDFLADERHALAVAVGGGLPRAALDDAHAPVLLARENDAQGTSGNAYIPVRQRLKNLFCSEFS